LPPESRSLVKVSDVEVEEKDDEVDTSVSGFRQALLGEVKPYAEAAACIFRDQEPGAAGRAI
jgi:hypothetical protein